MSAARVKFLLKLGLVVGLFYLLGQRGFLSFEATARAFTRLEHVLPAFGALMVTLLLTIARWNLLLRAQGIRVSLGRTLQLGCVGNFFNIALPGAVSGDLVKAMYAAKEIGRAPSAALGTILFDRVVGVSALVLVSAGAMAMSVEAPWSGKLFHAVRAVVGVASVGVVVFYAALFLSGGRGDPLLTAFRRIDRRFPRFGSVTRVYEGVSVFGAHRGVVAVSLGMSVLIHILVSFSCIELALALDQDDLPFLAQAVVVPLGMLVTAVPVMPAGVGTGHAAFSFFYSLIGSARGADIFNLYILYKLVEGGLGGLVYLRFRAREPLPTSVEVRKPVAQSGI